MCETFILKVAIIPKHFKLASNYHKSNDIAKMNDWLKSIYCIRGDSVTPMDHDY